MADCAHSKCIAVTLMLRGSEPGSYNSVNSMEQMNMPFAPAQLFQKTVFFTIGPLWSAMATYTVNRTEDEGATFILKDEQGRNMKPEKKIDAEPPVGALQQILVAKEIVSDASSSRSPTRDGPRPTKELVQVHVVVRIVERQWFYDVWRFIGRRQPVHDLA